MRFRLKTFLARILQRSTGHFLWHSLQKEAQCQVALVVEVSGLWALGWGAGSQMAPPLRDAFASVSSRQFSGHVEKVYTPNSPTNFHPVILPSPHDLYLFQGSKMLLLHCFSRVWLLGTAWTAAYQAPPSMGFTRQEHWSGLPLPSSTGRKMEML